MAEQKLTAKQDAFCREYLIDLNATQAAIRAGYSEASARQCGYENMMKPDVQERVAELMAERNKSVRIDAEYVLRQAVKIHERCMQEVEPCTTAKGEQIKDDDGNPLYAFDAKAAVAALKLVGDHVGVQAFKQQTELSGGITLEPKGLDDFYGRKEGDE